MREKQGQRFRAIPGHVQEVQVNAVKRDFVLRKGIQPSLLSSPVKSNLPVLNQGPQIRQIGTVGPRLAWTLVREARTQQTLTHVGDVCVRDQKAKLFWLCALPVFPHAVVRSPTEDASPAELVGALSLLSDQLWDRWTCSVPLEPACLLV